MRYWQSYRFAFNHPSWPTCLLLASVCLLIPIVGQIVLIGYLFEVIEALLRRRPTTGWGAAIQTDDDALDVQVMDALPADDDLILPPYPDFNFNRFSEYLTRGVWPFLVQLIINMIAGFMVGIVFVAAIALAGIASGAAKSPWPVLMGYAVAISFYAFAMFLVSILATPIYVRAGLSSDFGGAFSMAFYRDFMKRVGKEIVLARLFLIVTGAFLMIGGALLCYVGMFPAAVLLTYAQHHIDYQLYQLYLKRGGMAVPRKQAQSARRPRYAAIDRSSPHIMRPQSEERSTDVTREDKDW